LLPCILYEKYIDILALLLYLLIIPISFVGGLGFEWYLFRRLAYFLRGLPL